MKSRTTLPTRPALMPLVIALQAHERTLVTLRQHVPPDPLVRARTERLQEHVQAVVDDLSRALCS